MTTLLSDSNLTWMKFPTENTGLGMFWPQSLNSAAPSSDATLVIKTRAPPREPVQSVCWFGSSVKLRKVNLIISPAGTVIVEVHSVFRGKLFGKFGLVRNPLVPARSPSPHSAAKQNTSAWPHGKKKWSLLPILFKLQFALFHNLLKERAIQRRIQDFSRTDTTKRDFFKNEQTGSFFTRNEDLKIAFIDHMLVFSNQVSHPPKHTTLALKPNWSTLGIWIKPWFLFYFEVRENNFLQ